MKRLGILLCLLLLTTGCSSPEGEVPGDGPSGVSRVARDNSRLAPQWQTALRPITEPLVFDSTVVLLTRVRGAQLDVVGVDVASGKVSWRHPFAPGNVPNGMNLGVLEVKDAQGKQLVVFQRANKQVSAESALGQWPVVGVDPVTGTVAFTSAPIVVSQPLARCPGWSGVCASGGGPGSWGPSRMRINITDGRISHLGTEVSRFANDLGAHGLYADSGNTAREWLGLLSKDKVLWRRTVDEVFGAGFGSSSGWSFDYDPAEKVIVGRLGKEIPDRDYARYRAGKTVVWRVAEREHLAALDAKTGYVLWRERGVTTDCDPSDHEAEPEPWVRCRIKGKRLQNEEFDGSKFRDTQATVEGFDPRTGEVIWAVKLSQQGAEAVIRAEVVLQGKPAQMFATTALGAHVLDTTDGTLTKITDADLFLCQADSTKLRYPDGASDSDLRYGDRLSFLCAGSGKAVSGKLAAQAVADGGVPGPAGWFIVATKKGLAGYQLPQG